MKNQKYIDEVIRKIDHLEKGESIEISNGEKRMKISLLDMYYIYSENIWIATFKVVTDDKTKIVKDEEIEGLVTEFLEEN